MNLNKELERILISNENISIINKRSIETLKCLGFSNMARCLEISEEQNAKIHKEFLLEVKNMLKDYNERI